MDNLAKNSTWDWNSVEEWNTIKEKVPDAVVVSIHQLLGIKHHEKPQSEHVHKARIVCGGHSIRDVRGLKAEKDELYGSPIPVDVARLVIYNAVAMGHVVETADVDGAYLAS